MCQMCQMCHAGAMQNGRKYTCLCLTWYATAPHLEHADQRCAATLWREVEGLRQTHMLPLGSTANRHKVHMGVLISGDGRKAVRAGEPW